MIAPKIGVFLSTRLAATGRGDDPESFVTQGTLAEALGFDSVWVGDSLVARPRPEPIALLGALAARTSRVTLGTAVFLPAIRHPLGAAHSLATLDRLSQGRLVVGGGSGFDYPGTERELRAFGIPMKERVERVLESVNIWRMLWRSEGPVSHVGRYWSFEEVEISPRPLRPSGPQIWMGGNSLAAIHAAVENADGFLPTSSSPEVFRRACERVNETAERAALSSRALASGVVLTLNVDADGDRARRKLREYMEIYYGAPLESLSTFIGCFAGQLADFAEWISRYVEAGARYVVLRFASVGQLEQIERAAAELLPALGATRGDLARSIGQVYAEAWRRGDLTTLLELCADEIVLHYFGENPFAGRHEGKPALIRVLSSIQERTRRELVSIEDVLASDQRTALLVRERFRSGEHIEELERLLLYRVDRGRITECWLYDQDQRAFDALLS